MTSPGVQGAGHHRSAPHPLPGREPRASGAGEPGRHRRRAGPTLCARYLGVGRDNHQVAAWISAYAPYGVRVTGSDWITATGGPVHHRLVRVGRGPERQASDPEEIRRQLACARPAPRRDRRCRREVPGATVTRRDTGHLFGSVERRTR